MAGATTRSPATSTDGTASTKTSTSTFTALPPGGALELVNDHDPAPLHREFSLGFPGRFTWQYIEQGPQVWRVRIGSAVSPPIVVSSRLYASLVDEHHVVCLDARDGTPPR